MKSDTVTNIHFEYKRDQLDDKTLIKLYTGVFVKMCQQIIIHYP